MFGDNWNTQAAFARHCAISLVVFTSNHLNLAEKSFLDPLLLNVHQQMSKLSNSKQASRLRKHPQILINIGKSKFQHPFSREFPLCVHGLPLKLHKVATQTPQMPRKLHKVATKRCQNQMYSLKVGLCPYLQTNYFLNSSRKKGG